MTKTHKKTTKHGTDHHHHSGKKTQSSQGWQIATAVFVILFALSLFTGGFSNPNNKNVKAQDIGNALVKAGVITQTNLASAVDVIDSAINVEKVKTSKTTTPKGEKVDKPLNIELYVMSQCPYGVQAENTMFKAIKDLGEENFNLQVDYIATALGDGKFQSLHGQAEVDGDIRELCAKEQDKTKFLDYVLCMNENPKDIPGNWESCATKVGLDANAIDTCFNGQKGKDLLTKSTKASQNAQATGSPTIVINGAKYSGGRGVNDFKRAFCNAFEGEKPAACSDIPEPTKINVVVLNDKRCADCQAAQTSLVGQLKGLFPGMQVKTVDYKSAEGKALYKSTGTQFLPAFLFDNSVSKDDNYDKVKPYLKPAGDYTTLLIGASFDPTKEICDNKIDDTGNGKVDCADSDCSESLSCREEKPQQLQLFIMSDCPYGKEGVKALNTVQKNFGKNLNFEIHYIASETGDGFNSLHGTYEADEDMIQLCTKEHSPDVWFNYTVCRSIEGIKGNDWHNCATKTGVDVNAVETCFNGGEGADLLRKDIKIANGLGIGASPTWMANNKYQFSGIDAETVKTNFCKYNPGVAGCENQLASNTAAVPAGSCG